ncbi:MAG: hypothetical protein OZ921_03935 [Sorangiineae bacterium]|nr:hypothetical protein [Polyangiaceae bacterium]MEB2321641.1 hypothetical protein [Sorangiineae bacterium]
MRRLPSVRLGLAALALGAASLSCAGVAGDEADPDAGDCIPPLPGAWAIPADGLETTCATDADCVAVYLGENACEVARFDGGRNRPCPNAAIATRSRPAYQARYDDVNRACRQACGPGELTCAPVEARCRAGVCGP